jgi:hypothetical protein
MPLLMGFPVKASVVPLLKIPSCAPEELAITNPVDDEAMMRESLRRDVVDHPRDFVVFVTETGAKRFVSEHPDDVARERLAKIVSRGVVGYWQGKTIVVLPWAPSKNFR